MEKKNIIRVGKVVGGLLLAAFVCNFTVEGWQWGILDFVVLGALLFITGLALEYTISKVQAPLWRVIVCSVILLSLVAVWSELAVDAVSRFISAG